MRCGGDTSIKPELSCNLGVQGQDAAPLCSEDQFPEISQSPDQSISLTCNPDGYEADANAQAPAATKIPDASSYFGTKASASSKKVGSHKINTAGKTTQSAPKDVTPVSDKLTFETLAFMHRTGEEILLKNELATKKEIDSPAFYKRGGKGYWYALMLQRTGAFERFQHICEQNKIAFSIVGVMRFAKLAEFAPKNTLEMLEDKISYAREEAFTFLVFRLGLAGVMEIAKVIGDREFRGRVLNDNSSSEFHDRSLNNYFVGLYKNRHLIEKFGLGAFIEIANAAPEEAYQIFSSNMLEILLKKIGAQRVTEIAKASGKLVAFMILGLSVFHEHIKDGASLAQLTLQIQELSKILRGPFLAVSPSKSLMNCRKIFDLYGLRPIIKISQRAGIWTHHVLDALDRIGDMIKSEDDLYRKADLILEAIAQPSQIYKYLRAIAEADNIKLSEGVLRKAAEEIAKGSDPSRIFSEMPQYQQKSLFDYLMFINWKNVNVSIGEIVKDMKPEIEKKGIEPFIKMIPKMTTGIIKALPDLLKRYDLETIFKIIENTGDGANDAIIYLRDFLLELEARGDIKNPMALVLKISQKIGKYSGIFFRFFEEYIPKYTETEMLAFGVEIAKLARALHGDLAAIEYVLECEKGRMGLFTKYNFKPYIEIAEASGIYAPAIFMALMDERFSKRDIKEMRKFAAEIYDVMSASGQSAETAKGAVKSTEYICLNTPLKPNNFNEYLELLRACLKRGPSLDRSDLGKSIIALHQAIESAACRDNHIATLSIFVEELEAGNILPKEFLSPSIEDIQKNSDVYAAAFNFARTAGSEYEDRLVHMFDLGKLAREIDNAHSALTALRFLGSMHPRLQKELFELIQFDKNWLTFPYSSLNESNMQQAEDAAGLVDILSKFYAKGAYEDVLNLQNQLLNIQIDLPPAHDLESLKKLIGLAKSFEAIDKDLGNRIMSQVTKKINLLDIVRSATSSGRIDAKILEETRLQLNLVNRVYGDEFVLAIGVAMSNEKVTKDNFFKKLDEIDSCCFSGPSMYSDVNKLYQVVGRFQANALVTFMTQNRNKFTDKEFENVATRLGKMGVHVAEKDGTLSKLWRSIAKPAYVTQKALDKLSSSGVLREEYVRMTPDLRDAYEMRPGFSSKKAYYQGREIATIVTGNHVRGARISYDSRVGDGVRPQELKEKLGPSLVALAVAAYTTGERKMSDFAAQEGTIANYLISDRDGLAIMYPNGTLDIKRVSTLKKNDIQTPDFQMTDEPLDFRGKAEDFHLLVRKIHRSKASAFQGHLLLYNGELQLSEKSSAVQDKRRCLAIMNDGSFALIDFTAHVTLLEAAVLAARMGAKHLINLDTGMYDFSSFYDARGTLHKLGTFDSERPTNLVVFHTAPDEKPKNRQ